MKNIFYRVTLVTIALSATVLYAGNGSNFGASFGGSFAGSMLGNALTQPRSTRTEVVQVPVQQAAPAPRDDYDDSAALRKLIGILFLITPGSLSGRCFCQKTSP